METGEEETYSTVLVVDSSDLETLASVRYAQQVEGDVLTAQLSTGHGQAQHQTEDLTVLQSAQSTTGGVTEEESLTEREIRTVTHQFLQGDVPFKDLTALLEGYSRGEDDTEEASSSSTGVTEHGGTRSHKNSSPSTSKGRPPNITISPERSKTVSDWIEFSSEATSTFGVRRKKKVSPTIQGLIGLAHLRYVKSDHENAIRICMEIIKEEPTFDEAFNTLSMIYEAQNKNDKALQMALIAGLLNPKKCDQWHKLADMSVVEGNLQQAIMCCSKGIAADSSNIDLQFKRAELLVQVGDSRGALRAYQRMLYLNPTDGDLCLDVIKRMAVIYHQLDDMDKAYETLSMAFRLHPNHVSSTELNLILEVCITLRKYVEALGMLLDYGNVTFNPTIPDTSFFSRRILTDSLAEDMIECIVPDDLHSDLVQKLIIVLIHLEAYHISEKLLDSLQKRVSILDFGESYFEIAEAYMAKKEYNFALNILPALVQTPRFSQAAIWLRYGECLLSQEKYSEAEICYENVLKLAPTHRIAKLNMSVILQKLGRLDGALQSLDQDDVEDLIDADLLLEKCGILLQKNMIAEFYKTMLHLLSRHSVHIRNREETQLILLSLRSGNQPDVIQINRMRKQEVPIDTVSNFVEKVPDAQVEWRAYLKLCHALTELRQFDLLARLVYTASSSRLFSQNPDMLRSLELQSFYATVMNREVENFPIHIRTLFYRGHIGKIMLNLFSLALQRCEDARNISRCGKHILRFIQRYPDNPCLILLNANNNFITGGYKFALMEYCILCTVTPNDPLPPFMVANTLLHLISQKTATKRGQLAVQILAFMKRYIQLAGDCQESNYNMGRLLHFLGLLEHAKRYYSKVLQPSERNANSSLDLSREAAFNLAQIYKANGNFSMARNILYRYIHV